MEQEVLRRIGGYADDGQLNDLSYPGGIHTHSTFDGEGRPVTHTVGTTGTPGLILSDSLTYDPAGRIVSGRGTVVSDGTQQTLTMSYAGLGALASSELILDAGTPKLEQFWGDALGNVDSTTRYHVHLGADADEPEQRGQRYNGPGQLATVENPRADTGSYDEQVHTWYDAEGRVTYTGTHRFDSPSSPDYEQTASYYDGLGQLVEYERHVLFIGSGSLAGEVTMPRTEALAQICRIRHIAVMHARPVILKPAEWMGSALDDLRALPDEPRRAFGYAIHLAQLGFHHRAAKRMKGEFAGLVEVVDDFDGDTYRAIYTVRLAGVVYVLHVFQKKSTRGIATPKAHLAVLRERWRGAKAHYASHYDNK